MNETELNIVTDHKHLGVLLSNDGGWQKHIDLIVKKAFNRLNILRKFKFVLDRKSLEQIYISYIRPLVEYADIIWDNTTVMLIQKVESVQIEAARIVTGGTRLTSIAALYKETGWQKLSERRKAHRLTNFYKMVNNEAPLYLCDMLPDQFQNIHQYNTRNSNAFQPPLTRTALYSNYFLPATIRSWNALPQNTQTNHFKLQIPIKTPKPCYSDILL